MEPDFSCAFARVLECVEQGRYWEAQARFGVLGQALGFTEVIDGDAIEESLQFGFEDDGLAEPPEGGLKLP